MDNELNIVAMDIILHAGNARSVVRRVYEALAAADAEAAEAALDEARGEIRQAHRAQTAVIQAEAGGAEHTLTLLFSHAQDTLMTVNSEVVTAGNILAVFSAFDGRLRALEGDRQEARS